MRSILTTLLVTLLIGLPACGTLRGGIQGARILGAGILDDAEAMVDGVSRAERGRMDAE